MRQMWVNFLQVLFCLSKPGRDESLTRVEIEAEAEAKSNPAPEWPIWSCWASLAGQQQQLVPDRPKQTRIGLILVLVLVPIHIRIRIRIHTRTPIPAFQSGDGIFSTLAASGN